MHLIKFKTRAWGCSTYMQMKNLQAKVKFAVQGSKRFSEIAVCLGYNLFVLSDKFVAQMILEFIECLLRKCFHIFLTFNVDKHIYYIVFMVKMNDRKINNYTLFVF